MEPCEVPGCSRESAQQVIEVLPSPREGAPEQRLVAHLCDYHAALRQGIHGCAMVGHVQAPMGNQTGV